MSLSETEEKKLLLEILRLKKDILKMIYTAQSGHPGGSLSCTSLLYVLYKKIMNIDANEPCAKGRDYFILSKGHAAPALYTVLSKVGFINRDELFTLREFGSNLQGHPVKNEEFGIEISTGSLGMGLSIGVGCALAAKLDKSDRKIFVLLGDGELNEGSVWEAVMSASHFQLDNLIAIVDRNGIQIDGSTEGVMALEPLAQKWKAFGWNVVEIDGSNLRGLIDALDRAKEGLYKPTVIVSYLIKGSDVSFMEHTKSYHGKPPNEEEYQVAISEIDEVIEKISKR